MWIFTFDLIPIWFLRALDISYKYHIPETELKILITVRSYTIRNFSGKNFRNIFGISKAVDFRRLLYRYNGNNVMYLYFVCKIRVSTRF